MDAVDPDLVERTREVILASGGVLAVADLRVRWIGHTLHTEADVTVAGDVSLAAGHDIAHRVEAHLLEQVPRPTSAVIHVSPAGAHHLHDTRR